MFVIAARGTCGTGTRRASIWTAGGPVVPVVPGQGAGSWCSPFGVARRREIDMQGSAGTGEAQATSAQGSWGPHLQHQARPPLARACCTAGAPKFSDAWAPHSLTLTNQPSRFLLSLDIWCSQLLHPPTIERSSKPALFLFLAGICDACECTTADSSFAACFRLSER